MFTESNLETSDQTMSNSTITDTINFNQLNRAIEKAQEKLLSLQHPDGYWVFELEADCTIPAEYIMMMHYLDDINVELQEKLAVYIRSRQSSDGS